MKNYFGDITWKHYESEDSSAYLMLNKYHENSDEVVKKIAQMFSEVYSEFENTEAIEIT